MNKQVEATSSGKKTTQVVTCAERISPYQDSCWSWLVCFAGVISNVVICGFTYSYGILFPALLDEFQQGKAKTAWVGSIAMMGMGLYGPLIGRLYHRFGARIVAFFGSIICVVSLIVTSKISNLYIMYLTYGALFSFGSSCVFLTTYIAVPRYFMKWRSLSLGLIAMGPGGGLFIMSPIVQALFEKFGWRGTFLAMAGIDSIICVLAFVYKPVAQDSDRNEELNINQQQDKKFWDISIIKHKVYVFCTTAGIVYYLAHYIPPVHMVRYLEEIGFEEVNAPRLYIYSGVASLLVRPLIGRLNDVSWINMLYIYAVAGGLVGVVTFLLPLATTNIHFIMYFVVYGLADGTLGCGLSIAVLNSLPERLRPLGFGVYQCLACVTSACGPALGGLVADLKGSYVPVFNMVGAIMVIGAAMLFAVSCIKKPEKLSTKEEVAVWESLIVVEKCSVV
ncbi:monocarboxylate transporter 4-like [Oculina patagonica]